MRGAYERLFLAFYGWSLRTDGRANGYNLYYASLMLGVTLFINLVSLLLVADAFRGSERPNFLSRIPRISWILMMVVITAAQWLYFGNEKRLRSLMAKYSVSEEKLVKGPHWTLLVYMTTSVVALVAILNMRLR